MPKWLLFGLAAAGQFAVAAAVAYYSDRVVLPAVLAVAGLCMLLAAVGSARERK
jgi:hypothetical protein